MGMHDDQYKCSQTDGSGLCVALGLQAVMVRQESTDKPVAAICTSNATIQTHSGWLIMKLNTVLHARWSFLKTRLCQQRLQRTMATL